jgi:plasmid stabilization system protein ParE
MSRSLGLLRSALEDIAVIVDYALVTLGVDQALVVDDRIHKAISRLEDFADRGRVVPELLEYAATFRELVVEPYRIIYRVEPTQVWVIAVVDHHRNVERLLRDRASRR